MNRLTGALMLATGTFGLLAFEIANLQPTVTVVSMLAFLACLLQLFAGAYLVIRGQIRSEPGT